MASGQRLDWAGVAPSSFTASMAPSFSRRTAERTAISGDASYDPNGRSPTRSGLHDQKRVSCSALPAAHVSRAVPCITLKGYMADQAQPASCQDSNISTMLSTAGAQVGLESLTGQNAYKECTECTVLYNGHD